MKNLISKMINMNNGSEINLSGFIKYPNCSLYLDIYLYYNHDEKPVIKNIDDFYKYMDMDISADLLGAPLDIMEEETINLIEKDILNLLLDQIKFKELQKYNYSKQGYKYIYSLHTMYYDKYDDCITDLNNFYFDINYIND